MSIFTWMDSLFQEMLAILSRDVRHSLLMGALAVIVAGVALFFNHYNWKRARVLSTMTVITFFGWFFVNWLVFGEELHTGTLFRSVALMLLITIFLICGFWVAGIISALKPNPVVISKLYTANMLKNAATFLETTVVESAPVKRKDKEYQALEYIKGVVKAKAK